MIFCLYSFTNTDNIISLNLDLTNNIIHLKYTTGCVKFAFFRSKFFCCAYEKAAIHTASGKSIEQYVFLFNRGWDSY